MKYFVFNLIFQKIMRIEIVICKRRINNRQFSESLHPQRRVNTEVGAPIFAAATRMPLSLLNPTPPFLLPSVALMKSISCELCVRKTQKMILQRHIQSKMICISGVCSRHFIRHLPIPIMIASYLDTGCLKRRSACAQSTLALRDDHGIVKCNT